MMLCLKHKHIHHITHLLLLATLDKNALCRSAEHISILCVQTILRYPMVLHMSFSSFCRHPFQLLFHIFCKQFPMEIEGKSKLSYTSLCTKPQCWLDTTFRSLGLNKNMTNYVAGFWLWENFFIDVHTLLRTSPHACDP